MTFPRLIGILSQRYELINIRLPEGGALAKLEMSKNCYVPGGVLANLVTVKKMDLSFVWMPLLPNAGG